MRLDSGRDLHPVRVAYETYGELSPERDNVILVCHALSGDAHAAGLSETPTDESTRDGFGAEERDGTVGKGLGWWDGMIGPGKAFDTDRYFVVSTNLLGGCKGSTGPSSIDPATGRAVRVRLPGDHGRRHGAHPAGVPRRPRHRATGGGGGRLAGRHAGAGVGDPLPRPGRRRRGDRQHACPPPAGHGLERDRPRVDHARPRLAGRRLLRHGAPARLPAWAWPAWSATSPTCPHRALDDKFGRRLQSSDEIRYTITEPEFEVESYLDHQAETFVKRFDANTYLYTSRALTYFDLARQYGGGSLPRAFEGVAARTLLIAFSSDWLYPPEASQEIDDALRALGKPVELHVIDAPYGHDCFLLEEARQTPLIRQFLAAGAAVE